MNNVQKLEKLNKKIKICTKCPDLVQSRSNTVIYRGNPDAKIMLIGESSGVEEDQQGISFVGSSGKYLNTLLEKIGLDTEKDIFISNTIKCHPKGNRNPSTIETIKCGEYLDEQIKIIDPLLVITLGRIAGKWMSLFRLIYYYKMNTIYHGYPNWLPIYHPRYLSDKKEETYQAYKIIKEALKRVEWRK